MMFTFAPVSLAKSGARRCNGSAICGPVTVSTFTSTPANWLPLVPPPVVAVAGAAAVVLVAAGGAVVFVAAGGAVVFVAAGGAVVFVGAGGTAVAVGAPPVSQPTSRVRIVTSATRLNNLPLINSPPLDQRSIECSKSGRPPA